MSPAQAPLTAENYHTPENDRLTNSKIGDFMKSRTYFYEKHVERSLVEEKSPSLQLGTMVDAALTAGSIKGITDNWEVAVLKRDDPDAYARQKENPDRVVTATVMEKATEIAETVLRSRWYGSDSLSSSACVQRPIVGTLAGMPVAALPDRFEVVPISDDHDHVIVTDWKTSAAGDCATPWRWERKCKDYGYFRQFALMQCIFRQNIKKKRVTFEFRHAVIETTKVGQYRQHLFIIDEQYIQEAYWSLLDAVTEIGRLMPLGKEAFVDPTPSWDDAVHIAPYGLYEYADSE